MKTAKALIVSAMLAMSAILGFQAAADPVQPGTYEYLEKAVEVESGFDATVWRVDSVLIQMGQQPYLVVNMVGFKDVQAFKDGKNVCGYKSVRVNGIATTLQCYATVFQELMGKLIAEGDFSGAAYKTFTVE
jgi:hypothetical protein